MPLQQVGAALGVDPMAWVLTGGEDHALVATFSAAGRRCRRAGRRSGRYAAGRGGRACSWTGGPAADVVQAVGAEGAGHVHFG